MGMLDEQVLPSVARSQKNGAKDVQRSNGMRHCNLRPSGTCPVPFQAERTPRSCWRLCRPRRPGTPEEGPSYSSSR